MKINRPEEYPIREILEIRDNLTAQIRWGVGKTNYEYRQYARCGACVAAQRRVEVNISRMVRDRVPIRDERTKRIHFYDVEDSARARWELLGKIFCEECQEAKK